ncbi:class I SAM-dependent methyltransferase [Desulfogranum mediterraneum]|uniref:class I SAM-dependent methyltransferase n=1 Tax=Desulfogranum mediterraneum TaxID=160661 RepID=UPI0009FF3DD8|nr:class I SAM-dependent methyltransferase [Desulfogranum mediterraneum]
MSFQPHKVDWTPELVENIWNYYSDNPAYKNSYFAQHSGQNVLSEVSEIIGMRGNVLDVGCGPGYLFDHISKMEGWDTYTGIDSSSKSLEELRGKARGETRSVQGVSVDKVQDISKDFFDRVFCIEVLEHCDDDTLQEIFSLIHRSVKKDGFVIMTTPNREDLQREMQICPECGCTYHKWQHVRSWSCDEVAQFVSSCGFNVHSIFTCHFGRKDLGRGMVDSFAAKLRYRKQWRQRFLHLPQIMILATPVK